MSCKNEGLEISEREAKVILNKFKTICMEYPCNHCDSCDMPPIQKKLEEFIGRGSK